MNPFKNLSSDQTRDFYEGLVHGKNERGLWGMESRFDADQITKKPSVLKHFLPKMQAHIYNTHDCLDLGCGPGGFLALMAPLAKSMIGADIVPSFVKEAQGVIDKRGITNCKTMLLDGGPLPFADAQFDRVIMIDTIHHLEDAPKTLAEVARVLKPNGLFLIFEPNKYNPLLALMCALDKNEHGLLRLGSFYQYRKLLGRDFEFAEESYSGLLVGPEGKNAVAIGDFLSGPAVKWLGWLCPKLFIAARKK
ncbi:MAG: methyltransferase domain-containing protein [Alphaproteobacteria bacterium]|nr:methyltransferase domain-containing protein [Alphaproteobacteria bacterium]